MGRIRHHGLVGNAVIVSDDAGQFRVGTHALCWVHAERLLQKLMPATPGQVKHLETLRELIWHLYKALKAYRRKPDARAALGLQARFDRIFSIHTGYGDLDKLLFRLRRRKPELLRVLERPEIPLHTTATIGSAQPQRRQIGPGLAALARLCDVEALALGHLAEAARQRPCTLRGCGLFGKAAVAGAPHQPGQPEASGAMVKATTNSDTPP